jgi:hypothetical protein
MKEPFKFQYKSQNLSRLQDIFVNDTRADLKTNYTITNKSFKKNLKDIEFVIDKTSKAQTPSFIKKYNKVLNEFCIPEGKQFITVDLDEKLKLNYLQSQIDAKRPGGKKPSYQDKLHEIKVNYILGSPNRHHKSEIDYNINISPRYATSPKRERELVQNSNTFTKIQSNTNSPFNQINTEREYNDYANSYLRTSSPKNSTRNNFNRKEIFNFLYEKDTSNTHMLDKIYQMKQAKSQEKDLIRRVILTSKCLIVILFVYLIFYMDCLDRIPADIQNKFKKNFPDLVRADYPSPKTKFPSFKMNCMKQNIDKIFTKGFSTLRTPSFPVEKSNRVEIGDLNFL